MAAPKGNTNALSHGFYRSIFTKFEKQKLTQGKDNDLESEINLVRIIVGRIISRLDTGGLSKNKRGELDDKTLKTLNTLLDATTAISTLARSHQLITGKYLPVESAIMDALDDLNKEDGID